MFLLLTFTKIWQRNLTEMRFLSKYERTLIPKDEATPFTQLPLLMKSGELNMFLFQTIKDLITPFFMKL